MTRRAQEPAPRDVEARAPSDARPLEPAYRRLFAWVRELAFAAPALLWTAVVDTAKEQPYLVFALFWGLMRATGTTVKSGTTGLLYSFGRARRTIEPGFRALIPFLQIVVTVPTRSRTLDLPAQRVTSADGLVYFVDANLVYRVVEVRKALVEIDDIEKGMRQVLGLSVHEVVRARGRGSLRVSEELDCELAASMARRLAPWGTVVERAGFMSIRPSAETLRLTQLVRRVGARARVLAALSRGGVPLALALPMAGEVRQVRSRTLLVRQREHLARRRRRLRRALAKALANHPALARRAEDALQRWLLRITDSRQDQGLAWAKKSLGRTPRSLPKRRPGQPRRTAVKG